MRRRTRSQAKKEQTLKQKCQSLYHAVRDRKIQKALLFLEAGAKSDFIYLEDNMGFTPFHAALPRFEGIGSTANEEASQIHLDLLNLLFKNHTNSQQTLNIFSQDSYGMNAFEWAVADGQPMCTHWFLDLLHIEEGAKSLYDNIINRQNPLPSCLPSEKCKRIQYQTPIQLAVKSESLETVQELTQFAIKPDVGVCNANNMNAIHIAIKRKLPSILYELVNIAKSADLNQPNHRNEDALKYAQTMYQQSLTIAITACDILKLWKCKEIIKARINPNINLRQRWETIRNQSEPTHNAVMSLVFTADGKNPNTNVLKAAHRDTKEANVIHDDIANMNISMDQQEKYRVVSFEEACKLQHANENWVTSHHGKLDINERFRKTQQLSPFVASLKTLFAAQRRQLSFTYAPKANGKSRSCSLSLTDSDSDEEEMKESECNNNTNNRPLKRRKKKVKKLSEAIFLYKDEWIEVEALNKALDTELTAEDRIKFYQLSIGECANSNVEVREIRDVTHPCKRHSDGAVFGVFATKDLPKKTIILEYCGLLCTENEYFASLGSGTLERFDSQWRNYKCETFKTLDGHQLLIDASYCSNESVFVNDASHDEVFEKWSTSNVSFFEIKINGWPHIFLRVFDYIEAGDECLVNYGGSFWKQHQKDMAKSQSLNAYHIHRLERVEEAKLVNKERTAKRKRDEIGNGVELNCLEPQTKRMRIDNDMNHNLNVNDEIMNEMKEKLSSMEKRLNEKDKKIQQLQQAIENFSTINQDKKKKLALINDRMPIIINEVELLANENKEKDKEIQRLTEKVEEYFTKKTKYKKTGRNIWTQTRYRR